MNWVNLTPHQIHLPGLTLESNGEARCHEYTREAAVIDGVPVVHRGYGAVMGLPDPQPDTIYVVSMLVRLALPHRHDVASPGDLERDSGGRIVGARNLVMNP